MQLPVPSWSWLSAGCGISFYSWIRLKTMTPQNARFITSENPPILEFSAYTYSSYRTPFELTDSQPKSVVDLLNGFPSTHFKGLLDRWEANVYGILPRDGNEQGRLRDVGLVCFDSQKEVPEEVFCIILGAGRGPAPTARLEEANLHTY